MLPANSPVSKFTVLVFLIVHSYFAAKPTAASDYSHEKQFPKINST